ncbi:hypothetical protein ACFV01_20435, partial [Streptomyces sp. NPDC059616]
MRHPFRAGAAVVVLAAALAACGSSAEGRGGADRARPAAPRGPHAGPAAGPRPPPPARPPAPRPRVPPP